jgi:hypothetical protein
LHDCHLSHRKVLGVFAKHGKLKHGVADDLTMKDFQFNALVGVPANEHVFV